MISYKNKSNPKEKLYQKSLMSASKSLTSAALSKNNLAINQLFHFLSGNIDYFKIFIVLIFFLLFVTNFV